MNSTSLSSIFVIRLSTTTQHIPMMKKNFPIRGVVGILLGLLLLFIVCIIKARSLYAKMKDMCLTRHPSIGRINIRPSLAQAVNYYRVTARMNKYQSRKYTLSTIDENDEIVEEINNNINSRQDSVIIQHETVKIEC